MHCCGVSSSETVNENIQSESITTTTESTPTTTEQLITAPITTTISVLEDVITVTPQPSINVYKQNQRQIRLLNNVSLIYPSEMTGIPKSRPRNMSDDEPMPIKMMDEDSGKEMLVVFPVGEQQTTTEEATPTTASTTTTTITMIVDPIQDQTQIDTTTTTKPKVKKRKYLKKVKRPKKPFRPKILITTTTSSPNIEPIMTTVRTVAVDDEDAKSKITELYKRRRVPIRNFLSTLTTTLSPFSDSEFKPESSKVEAHEEEYMSNRVARKMSIIFDPARRMNFFRRPTTPEPEVPTTTYRPESISHSHTSIDLDHKNMIADLHSMLATGPIVSEVPRAIMDPAVNSRVARIEDKLKNKITDMVNRMVGNKADVRKEQVELSVRRGDQKPYRGRVKFMVPNSWSTQQTQHYDYDQSTANTPSNSRRGQFARVTTEATTTTTTTERSLIRGRRPILRRGRVMTPAPQTTTTTTTPSPPLTTTTIIPETITEIIITEPISDTEPISVTESILVTEPISVTETIPLKLPNTVNILMPPPHFPVEDSVINKFRPSPLWTLHTEETVPKNVANTQYAQEFVSNRQSRSSFTNPSETYGGFIPVIHNGNPLNIIGPLPSGFRVLKDDTSNVGLELPRDLRFSSPTSF